MPVQTVNLKNETVQIFCQHADANDATVMQTLQPLSIGCFEIMIRDEDSAIILCAVCCLAFCISVGMCMLAYAMKLHTVNGKVGNTSTFTEEPDVSVLSSSDCQESSLKGICVKICEPRHECSPGE